MFGSPVFMDPPTVKKRVRDVHHAHTNFTFTQAESELHQGLYTTVTLLRHSLVRLPLAYTNLSQFYGRQAPFAPFPGAVAVGMGEVDEPPLSPAGMFTTMVILLTLVGNVVTNHCTDAPLMPVWLLSFVTALVALNPTIIWASACFCVFVNDIGDQFPIRIGTIVTF